MPTHKQLSSSSPFSLFLPLFALLLPLFFLPLTLDFFSTNKQILIVLFGTLALLIWTIRNLQTQKISFSLLPSTLPFFLLAVIYFVSSFLSGSAVITNLLGFPTTLTALFLIYFVITSLSHDDKIVSSTMNALVISGIIVSLVQILSYFGLFAKITTIPLLASTSFNTIGNPANLIVFNLSLVVFLIYRHFVFHQQSKLKLTLIVLPLLISSILSILSINKTPFIFLPLPFPFGWAILLDTLKSLRTALIGVGPENFYNAFTRFRPAAFNSTPIWLSSYNFSSNQIFQAFTTVGLIGGLLWLKLIWGTYRLGLSTFRKSISPLFNSSFLLAIVIFISFLLLPANAFLLGYFTIILTLLSVSQKVHAKATKDFSISAPWLKWVNLAIIGGDLFTAFFIFQNYRADVIFGLAQSYVQTDSNKVINLESKAIQIAPYNSFYKVQLSRYLIGQAQALVQNKETPTNPKILSQMYSQSIALAQNAAAIDPNNSFALANLGDIYSQTAAVDPSIKDKIVPAYDHAISLDPQNPQLFLRIGNLFLVSQNYGAAENVLSQAIYLKPDWADAHYYLGLALQADQKFDQALSEFKTSLNLVDPQSEEAKVIQEKISALELQTKNKPTTTPPPPNTLK